MKFKTLLEKITPQAAEEPQEAIEVTIVSELSDKDLSNEMAIHVEMMDENYLTAEILGISLADEKNILFIPLEVAKESTSFKNWLQNDGQDEILV